MKLLGFEIKRPSTRRHPAPESFAETCKELAKAVDGAKVGETTDKIQQLIFKYYEDVQAQAAESFNSAATVAVLGFALFACALLYMIGMDFMHHIRQTWFATDSGGLGVGSIGLIGGSVVELIAGTQFFLYRNTAKQFGAFHVCLERTHRYLLAYTMAENIGNKDQALEKIVCIVANAPMITFQNVEGANPKKAGELFASVSAGQ